MMLKILGRLMGATLATVDFNHVYPTLEPRNRGVPSQAVTQEIAQVKKKMPKILNVP